MSTDWQVSDILNYWYSEPVKLQWFNASPELDSDILKAYQELWLRAADGQQDHWMQTADGCLALCIVLDQFPLNMFRGQARSFSTEKKAIEVAKYAIEQDFDTQIALQRVQFLYMPLMHSENLDDQKLSVQLFSEAELSDNLRFARHHLSIIEKFHRFPHRNAILGRENSKEEQAYLASKQAFKG